MAVAAAGVRAADTAFAAVRDFYLSSRYGERRLDPGICDFTFGNPHEMPLPGIVAALRERAVPRDESWFAYKTSEAEPQEFLAERLSRQLGLPFSSAGTAPAAPSFALFLAGVT